MWRHDRFVDEAASRDRSIEDSNLGRQMLKGMGWKEGTGLGADGTGLAEPVRGDGQLDKVGLGSRQPSSSDDFFANYRQSKSSTYHTRIIEKRAA